MESVRLILQDIAKQLHISAAENYDAKNGPTMCSQNRRGNTHMFCDSGYDDTIEPYDTNMDIDTILINPFTTTCPQNLSPKIFNRHLLLSFQMLVKSLYLTIAQYCIHISKECNVFIFCSQKSVGV
jgi:hypothetical protein